MASPGATLQTAADANVASEMPPDDDSKPEDPLASMFLTAGPGGSVSPSSGSYKIGTIVNPMAKPNSGYAFSSWVGDCAGQGSTCSLTMNANKVATAHFICAGGYYSTGGTCQLIPTCGAYSSWNGSSCVCNSDYSLINGTCQLTSNWVDITPPGSTTRTMLETRSNLKWSNRRPDATWQGAINHCSALTYNGVTGWRLPSIDDLRAAHKNGMPGAAKQGWITASDMQAYFWSASSYSDGTNNASIVYLVYGNTAGNSTIDSSAVVCVQ